MDNEFYFMSLTDDLEIEAVTQWYVSNGLDASYIDNGFRTVRSGEVLVRNFNREQDGAVIAESLVCNIHYTELWSLIVYLRQTEIEEAESLAYGIVDCLKTVCYDDGISNVLDRYTIFFTDIPVHKDYPNTWLYAAANGNPFHPAYGFYQHGELTGDPEEFEHLGMRVELSELPEDVQQAVVNDFALEVQQ